MKLYTRRGDDGSTSLAGGKRVPKDDPRVAAYGEVDATSAAIGVAIAACDDEATAGVLRRVQSELFVLGANLAAPNGEREDLGISDAHVARLERSIDEASAGLVPLKSFVLPGGSEAAARLHVARTACRRAERAAITASKTHPVGPSALAYLNRLSDLLFALARRANHRAGVTEIPWEGPG